MALRDRLATKPAGWAPQRAVRPIRVRPSAGWRALDLAELWLFRDLVYFLVWRDVKVRYKQTLLGLAWAVLQPLATMAVFAVFFAGFAGMPTDGQSPALFYLSALVPWTFFAQALSQSANSLVTNQGLVQKVYFPRLALPIAAVVAGLVDLVLAFAVLLGLLLWFGVALDARVAWLPALTLLAFATSLGAGLWLSALNVRYRDVRHLLPFLVQIWFFVTPIAYPASVVPERWRSLLGLNPMAGVVEGFRWALLGSSFSPGRLILVSALGAALLMVTGALYFRRVERTFADIA